MRFRGSSGRPCVPAKDVSPPFGDPGEKTEPARAAVGVAVPELLPDPGSDDVEAKRVDSEGFVR
jgi:hypothetical protein